MCVIITGDSFIGKEKLHFNYDPRGLELTNVIIAMPSGAGTTMHQEARRSPFWKIAGLSERHRRGPEMNGNERNQVSHIIFKPICQINDAPSIIV